jgi:hypothetical protein
VDYVFIFVALVTVASVLPRAFGTGDDVANWELRWRCLPPADRARIAAAVRSNATLADPEEAELAAGFRRREDRRRAYIELPVAPLIFGAAALALTGTISNGDFGFIASMALVFTAFVVPRLVKWTDGRLLAQ